MDVLRSYLTTIIPETKDSDFKWDVFKNITNADLIGKLGNFFNRTLNLIWKNFDGQLNYGDLSGLNDNDNLLIEGVGREPILIGDLFFGVELREAYKRVMQYATMGNVYLNRAAPWNLIKEERTEEARKTLYLALNLCKSLAIVSSPILPNSMQRLWSEQLNLPGSLTAFGVWDEATRIDIVSDHKTNKPNPPY